jgi:hypothetical protein
MIDHDIDPEFERQLRSTLDEIAARFDPSLHPVRAQSGGRRVAVVSAAAALIAVGVVGVAAVATRPSDGTTPSAASSVPAVAPAADAPVADRLLYPGQFERVAEVSVVEGSGAQIALLESPSGRQHQVRVGRIGSTVLDAVADRRELGGRPVVAERDEHGNYYRWIDQCVLGLVQTTGADDPAWNDEDLALLSAIGVDTSEVTLDVPPGWAVFNTGAANPLIQLVFDVDIDGVEHTVVLGQSIGGSIAATPPGLSGEFARTDRVPGRVAWVAEAVMSPVLLFDNSGVAVGLWGTDATVDDLVAVATQLVAQPDAWSELLSGPIDVAPPDTPPPGAAPPEVCGPPTLTIR